MTITIVSLLDQVLNINLPTYTDSLRESLILKECANAERNKLKG